MGGSGGKCCACDSDENATSVANALADERAAGLTAGRVMSREGSRGQSSAPQPQMEPPAKAPEPVGEPVNNLITIISGYGLTGLVEKTKLVSAISVQIQGKESSAKRTDSSASSTYDASFNIEEYCDGESLEFTVHDTETDEIVGRAVLTADLMDRTNAVAYHGDVTVQPWKNGVPQATKNTATIRIKLQLGDIQDPAVSMTVMDPIEEDAEPVAADPVEPEPEAPKEEPAPKPVLELVMESRGTEKTFIFEELGPGEKLGITFETGKVPIVVQSFPVGSKAEQKGMRLGMTLKKINGEPVAGLKYSAIMDMVKEGVNAVTKE